MAEEDQRVLQELFISDELPSADYHPRMRAVHEKNVAALKVIISRHGWPSIPLVGKEASKSAWLIAQHAVFDQDFMEECVVLLKQLVTVNEVEGWQRAFLQDRILTMSGKEQIYGTQFDIDDEGWPIPFPITEPEKVNERRKQFGLNSLEERLNQMREQESLRRKTDCPDKS